MPEDKTTEPTSSDPKPESKPDPQPEPAKVAQVELTTEEGVLAHELSETLVKLHEKAKAELKAAEVVLVRVRHEVGQRVTGLFRKVS